MGTIKQPSIHEDMSFYQNFEQSEDLTIYHGFEEIDNFFQSKFRNLSVLAIRDYYPWWASQGERFDAGKLLFLHKDELKSNNRHNHSDNNNNSNDNHINKCNGNFGNTNSYCSRVLQFFFDDNLRVTDLDKQQLIVDVRDIETGGPFPSLDNLFGKVLFQANPLDAIQRDNYFVDLVLSRAKD
eukprot:TRINITY_DN5594_c0_g3_i1.p1 TRINITY_DN5594_c0_g3~~TRINITY_DN5594_c0_g3_i1.p1  ORF type:complete len:183 (-),score=37.50 TRINITY_DN5594_c0_g3_i1:80-628(-)